MTTTLLTETEIAQHFNRVLQHLVDISQSLYIELTAEMVITADRPRYTVLQHWRMNIFTAAALAVESGLLVIVSERPELGGFVTIALPTGRASWSLGTLGLVGTSDTNENIRAYLRGQQ